MSRFPAEALALLGVAGPATASSTPLVSSYVAAKNYHKLFGVVALGDMASETIDCVALEATDGSGTGAQAYKAAVQLAAHASNNDLKQLVFEIDTSKLSTGFTHVALRVTTGNTTGGPVFLGLFGSVNRYDPAVDSDLASVVQVLRKT